MVQFWDAESGDLIGAPLEHAHLVHDLAVSADGSRVVTACHDKSARVWDFHSRELLATFTHETRVMTVDFRGQDGSELAI